MPESSLWCHSRTHSRDSTSEVLGAGPPGQGAERASLLDPHLHWNVAGETFGCPDSLGAAVVSFLAEEDEGVWHLQTLHHGPDEVGTDPKAFLMSSQSTRTSFLRRFASAITLSIKKQCSMQPSKGRNPFWELEIFFSRRAHVARRLAITAAKPL